MQGDFQRQITMTTSKHISSLKKHKYQFFHTFRQGIRQNLILTLLLAGIFLSIYSCQPNIPEAPAAASPSPSTYEELPSGSLEVHVLDVGQGLSVFIRSENSCLLYDGGGRASSSFVISYLQGHNVERLDYIVASHYDSDHLSGIVGAVNVFPTGILIAPDYESATPVYGSFLTAIEEKELQITRPISGTVYSLGDGSFEILAPLGTDYEDENDYSVVIRVSIGDQSLLLTGDASHESEQEMLSLGDILESDVLIIGHHGSAGSTREEFLKMVSPDYVIASCGLGNDYGHPSRRVTELLSEHQLPFYRTDMQGTIDFVMMPEKILFSQSPCNNYTPGKDMPSDSNDFHSEDYTYILNTRTHRFHLPDCNSVTEMSDRNRRGSNMSREELLQEGYTPCGSCKP